MNENAPEDIRIKLNAMANESEKNQPSHNEKLLYMSLVLEALDSTMPRKDLGELLTATAARYNEIRPSENYANTISKVILESPYFAAENERTAFKKLDHDDIQIMLRFIAFVLYPRRQGR